MKQDDNEWIVSDKYCKGCKWYGSLCSGSSGIPCCDYTFYTGRIRENPPKTCEVKEAGKLPKGFRRKDYCAMPGRKGGR